KQLVGILPLNKSENIEEGQHIIESETLSTPIHKPVKMLGHITSSYHSPTLDHCVAMALVEGGHKLIGGKAFVSTPNLKTIPVQIVKPAFVDPKNEKLLS
ncbi:MAG: glycine cleavage T C-terminal barrel domain-containing protein, partial [Alphaproteobacteria bacterium]|nr:glycine cleavage T C-terminal barrel domain-containing protein [Alphaproteobacteria bacterium]